MAVAPLFFCRCAVFTVWLCRRGAALLPVPLCLRVLPHASAGAGSHDGGAVFYTSIDSFYDGISALRCVKSAVRFFACDAVVHICAAFAHRGLSMCFRARMAGSVPRRPDAALCAPGMLLTYCLTCCRSDAAVTLGECKL